MSGINFTKRIYRIHNYNLIIRYDSLYGSAFYHAGEDLRRTLNRRIDSLLDSICILASVRICESLYKPISSELRLGYFQRAELQNTVQELVDLAYMDPSLRCSVHLEVAVMKRTYLPH